MDGADPPHRGIKDGRQQSVTLREAAKHILTDRTFLVFWTGSFFLTAMFVQALSTFPLYIAQLGIGPDTYGRIIAVNGLMIVLLQLPTTSIVSRYHRGIMLTMSALVMAGGFGLTAVATTPWPLALTVIVWTVGEMMHAPLMSAIISDIAPVHLRARYMGVHAISFSAALMTCAPLGGLVLEHFGGRCLWTLSGVAGLIAGLAFWGMRKRITTPREPSIA